LKESLVILKFILLWPRVYLDERDTTNSLSTLALGRERFPADLDLMNMELDILLKQGKTELLMKKLDDAIATD
jgi:hypothetical protein